MNLFRLRLQITNLAVLTEYSEVDDEIVTEDLAIGSLLKECTLVPTDQTTFPSPCLELQLQIRLSDAEEDAEGNVIDYLPEEVFKELKHYPFWVTRKIFHG